jgi:hypothetical protein
VVVERLIEQECRAIHGTEIEKSVIVKGTSKVDDVARVQLLPQHFGGGETGNILKHGEKFRE